MKNALIVSLSDTLMGSMVPMDNPYAIHIRCDGAMDYDSKQTGGVGFVIEFPDSTNLPSVEVDIRIDGEGIHRLELNAVVEGMKELLKFQKENNSLLKEVSGVVIHSDRASITDAGLTNPYRIQAYRKAGWRTHEDKPVKQKELLDAIDKGRKKLSSVIPGRIEIIYTRRKQNKVADKLAKKGKRGLKSSKSILKRRKPKIASRLLGGEEIKYNLLSVGEILDVHTFYKDPVQEEYELRVEVLDGDHTGKTLKIYISKEEEISFHRKHVYRIEITEVKTHHARIEILEEVTELYPAVFRKKSKN